MYILTVNTSIQPKNRVAHCCSSSLSFHSPSRYHSHCFTLFRAHTRERTSSSACCFCSILFSFSSNARHHHRHCHHRRRRCRRRRRRHRSRRLLAKHNWYVCVATHFECTHYISACLCVCVCCVSNDTNVSISACLSWIHFPQRVRVCVDVLGLRIFILHIYSFF